MVLRLLKRHCYVDISTAAPTMPCNKPRLQLALYARPKHPDSYHYALLISPKTGTGRIGSSASKHHALDTFQSVSGEVSNPWRDQHLHLDDVKDEHYLLVRIIIAKIIYQGEVADILGEVPVYQRDDPDHEKARAFDCVAWVRDAVHRLRVSGTVSGLSAFDNIERRSLQYVERKKNAGRWAENLQPRVPTLDLLQEQELTE